MQKGLLACLALLAATGLPLTPADSQTPATSSRCDDTAVAAQQRIEACTSAIASGGVTSAALAATLQGRGRAYADQGEADRAIADLSEAIRLDPAAWAAFFNRGRLYYAHGTLLYGSRRDKALEEFDRAIADYTEVIRLYPTLAGAFSARGDANFNKLDLDRAIADYDAAIKLDPNSARAFFMRGYARFSKGNPDQAFADYAVAISLKPDYLDAFEARGRIYLIGSVRRRCSGSAGRLPCGTAASTTSMT